MLPEIPKSWRRVLAEELDKPYFKELQRFLAAEQKSYTIYPPEKDIFSALRFTPYENVNVLLLGQDPYPSEGNAHGLSFSVRPGIKPPPSLVNIYKELATDIKGFHIPNNGYLVPWARQGVLLLNAVLTLRAGKPNSHKGKGWEIFTDAIIRKVNDKQSTVVFALWGNYAQKKAKLITNPLHVIVPCAHPAPLSVNRGFFRCRPFSKINKALRDAGKPEINWQIPDIELPPRA
jgi:uracil-DNA glycosylase